jgi:CheY-specific phosphatase CheX
MTATDPTEILSELVRNSCEDLFAHYELPLARVDPETQPRSSLAFCGVIGFTGDDIRGTLLLAASREPLAAVGDTDVARRDWMAEMTNQLFGRIKNRLIALGPVIYCSTPIVLRGEYLAPVVSQPYLPQVFTVNGGVVSVWFDAEVKPDIVLAQSPDYQATSFEGETLLF